MARYANWQSDEAQTFVTVCGFDSHPCYLFGLCSSRLTVNQLSQNKRGGRREVQFLHDPLDTRPVGLAAGCETLNLVARVRFPYGLLTQPSGGMGRHATLRMSCHLWRGSSNLPLATTTIARVSQCSAGSHKPGPSGATPEPAT